MSERVYCIDARCVDGGPGGVQQVLVGLAKGFSNTSNDSEKILFLVYEDQSYWLEPHIRGNCDFIRVPPLENRLKVKLREAFPILRSIRRLFPVKNPLPHDLPSLPPALSNTKVDLFHFALQQGFRTEVPSVFTPHDLQHLHFPNYFSEFEFKRREVIYRKLCEQAKFVTAMTANGRIDLITRYGLSPGKVVVVPWAPVNSSSVKVDSAVLDSVSKRIPFESGFLYYPARTYKHKNHIPLLKALSILKDKGTPYNLVCSGTPGDGHEEFLNEVKQLGLKEHVHHAGFVSAAEVEAFYHSASLLVFPSLFEGWGLPILEAFQTGLPVVCSEIPPLKEIAGDAVLFFNPQDSQSIAQAIHRAGSDEKLRSHLKEHAAKRVQLFTWQKTAAQLRSYYREALGIENPAKEQIIENGL